MEVEPSPSEQMLKKETWPWVSHLNSTLNLCCAVHVFRVARNHTARSLRD